MRSLRALRSPAGIQCALDAPPYHLATTAWSPRWVLAERAAHCFEGAIFAAVEARAHLGHLDVPRTVREIEPVLAAWTDILRRNPVRGRQVLKEVVAGPIPMEPLPEGEG